MSHAIDVDVANRLAAGAVEADCEQHCFDSQIVQIGKRHWLHDVSHEGLEALPLKFRPAVVTSRDRVDLVSIRQPAPSNPLSEVAAAKEQFCHIAQNQVSQDELSKRSSHLIQSELDVEKARRQYAMIHRFMVQAFRLKVK